MSSGIQLLKQAAAGIVNAAAGKVRLFVSSAGRLSHKDESGTVTTYSADGALPYDISAFVAGAPGASQIVLKFVADRAVAIADDFAGSRAHAEVAATASTVFDVQVNGVSIGSITFAIAATTATFATTGGAVALAAGDRITVIAPGSPDATLASIAFTLLGAA